MSNPQRVLHILSSTMRAGVEMTLMNVYREIDRDKLQFDFVVHDLGQDDFGNEIAQMGGKVFRIPLLSKVGLLRFVNIIHDIMIQNGPYIAVHTHTDYQGGVSAMAAKKAGVPIRICHAHSDTRSLQSLTLFVKIQIGRIFIQRYATQRCACSKKAGISLFGKRITDKGKVKIINNSVKLSEFRDCAPEVIKQLRHECNADKDTRIIGFVGRLNPEKNPSFIIDMAAESKKRNLNDRYIFVGTGVMLEALICKVKTLGLEDSVFFLGTRDDVPALMQCFSIMVVTSFAEGFSLVTAEAQAAGTPVLAASCVPPEADMGLDLLHFMPLSAGAGSWVEQVTPIVNATIRPDTETRISALKAKGFSAQDNVDIILSLYGLNTPKQRE